MENGIFTTLSLGMGSRLAARHRTIVPVLFPACFGSSLSLTFDLEIRFRICHACSNLAGLHRFSHPGNRRTLNGFGSSRAQGHLGHSKQDLIQEKREVYIFTFKMILFMICEISRHVIRK